MLGSGGQVGRALLASAAPERDVRGLSRAELDIASADAVETLRSALRETRADWIVNAAAYTQVDRAEDEPERARAINAQAVARLSRIASEYGARWLQLSTDFVFDGRASRAYRPGDAANPLSVYGASKRDGEIAALASSEHVVVRTSWVYAARGHNFVLTMLKLMRERQELRIVHDQTGSPTWATSLARALWGLMQAQVRGGIYHFCDEGVTTWFEFARAIQEEALARGLLSRAAELAPIPTSDYPTKARRPAFSALDCAATLAVPGVSSRPWRENLRVMLDELRAS